MRPSFKCFQCGKDLNFPHGVGRRDECPHCHADVHVCRNCEFYDTKSYNECREPTADPVKEKDRANFCEHFTPGGQTGGKDQKADLLKAAEALFKKN